MAKPAPGITEETLVPYSMFHILCISYHPAKFVRPTQHLLYHLLSFRTEPVESVQEKSLSPEKTACVTTFKQVVRTVCRREFRAFKLKE